MMDHLRLFLKIYSGKIKVTNDHADVYRGWWHIDFTNGMKKAFLASVGAAATTAEVTKDILEKMIEKGERTVEQGKVLNH